MMIICRPATFVLCRCSFSLYETTRGPKNKLPVAYMLFYLCRPYSRGSSIPSNPPGIHSTVANVPLPQASDRAKPRRSLRGDSIKGDEPMLGGGSCQEH